MDEDQIWRYIEKELNEKQEKSNQQYVEIIGKMQTSLQELEDERDDIDDRLHCLENELHNEKKISSEWKEKYLVLDHNYNKLLIEFELLDSKNKENEEALGLAKAKALEIEKSLRSRMNIESNEQERRIKELDEQCQEIIRERDGLLLRMNDVLCSQSMTEEIQGLQKNQLKDIMDKYSQASFENERMKRKIEMLLDDKKLMSDLLEERNREVNDLHEHHAIEVKKLQAQHANALKQKEIELATHTRITNLNADDLLLAEQLRKGTRLEPLDFDEKDHQGSALINPAMLAMMRGTIRASHFVIPKSGRNLLNSSDVARKFDDKIQEEIRYLV